VSPSAILGSLTGSTLTGGIPGGIFMGGCIGGICARSGSNNSLTTDNLFAGLDFVSDE
jgi:hypothetical protein